MYYADIKDIDIQDGDGIRTALYVSGCHFHCKDCHNKEAWNFKYGKEFDEEAKQRIFNNLSNSYVQGLSILGGEPLELTNQIALAKFIQEVKEKFPEKDIWLWTGYKFDKDVLEKMYFEFKFTRELMQNIDYVVDGQFVADKKLVDLKFRGSYNQRLIDVQESIKNMKLIQLEFGDEQRFADIVDVTEKAIAFKELTNNIANLKKKAQVFIQKQAKLSKLSIDKPIKGNV